MRNKFGEYLKELRLKKDYSINRLALKSDVSEAHISRIENGLRPPPSPEIVNKLAKALGVDPKKMMEVAGYIKKTVRTSPEQKIKNALSNDPTLDDELNQIMRDLGPDVTLQFYDLKGMTDEEKENLKIFLEGMKARREKKEK